MAGPGLPRSWLGMTVGRRYSGCGGFLTETALAATCETQDVDDGADEHVLLGFTRKASWPHLRTRCCEHVSWPSLR